MLVLNAICAMIGLCSWSISEDRHTDDIKENLIPLVCYVVLKIFATLFLIKQVKALKKLWQELFSSEKKGETEEYLVRKPVTHSPVARVPLLCFYHMLTSSVTYHWTEAKTHEI